MDNYEAGVGGESYLYRDQTKSDMVENEKNISLFANLHVNGVETRDGKIHNVTAVDIQTLKEMCIRDRPMRIPENLPCSIRKW